MAGSEGEKDVPVEGLLWAEGRTPDHIEACQL